MKLLAALEFGSLSMLGWLAAAVLPWLIHRWSRQQHRTTPWAAVDLLLTAMRQRARRVALQQWLLLAIRTAILVLVALAAAEPTYRQWAVAGSGQATTHHLLVVDQSFSMQFQDTDQTRFAEAKQQAEQIIANSAAGDAFTIIAWGDLPRNLLGRPTFDAGIARSALAELEPTDAHNTLSSLLPKIAQTIERAADQEQLSGHRVYFLTDLARMTWTLTEQQRGLLEEIAAKASLMVQEIGSGTRANVAITDLGIEPSIPTLQQECRITARMQAWGEVDGGDHAVTLTVEGRQVANQSVTFASQDELQVEFSHRFVSEGAHTLQVSLDAGDDLPGDDARWLVAEVRPRLRIACIAGSTGAADSLARALTPASGTEESRSPYAAEIVPLGRFSQLQVKQYDALFFANVPTIDASLARRLADYVRGGGAMALFLGEATNISQFVPSREEQTELLPIEILNQRGPGDFRFDPLEYRHPILSPFRGRTQAGLLNVAVSNYVQFAVDDAESAEIVLSFDTGDPALVVDQFGLGRVAVSALPDSLAVRNSAEAPWSSFPVSPSFLPVIRELAAYLIGAQWLNQRNQRVAQSLVAHVDPTAPMAELRVQLPAGNEAGLLPPEHDDGRLVAFANTLQRGIYRFTADETELARFAVNVNPRECDPSRISSEVLEEVALAIEPVGRGGTLAGWSGVSFVPMLLTAAVFLLFIEIAIACAMGRRWG